MRITTLIVLLFSAVVIAEDHVISKNAPKGMGVLASSIATHYAPPNKGQHGLIEYCYKAGAYVVYSTNLLGKGYRLSSPKPEDLKCINQKTTIIAKNKLGMQVGMSKKQFQELVGNIKINDYQELIWSTQTMHNGQEYDLQTYLKSKFNNDKLVWLSVFTTETN